MGFDVDDQGLFDLDRGLVREPTASSPGPVNKTFRPFAPDQVFLLPPRWMSGSRPTIWPGSLWIWWMSIWT